MGGMNWAKMEVRNDTGMEDIMKSEYRCLKCGAEWESRRGNRETKEGSVCGAAFKVGKKFHTCTGTLVNIGRSVR